MFENRITFIVVLFGRKLDSKQDITSSIEPTFYDVLSNHQLFIWLNFRRVPTSTCSTKATHSPKWMPKPNVSVPLFWVWVRFIPLLFLIYLFDDYLTVSNLLRLSTVLGLKSGDAIAIWGPNQPEWLVTKWAAAKVNMPLVRVRYQFCTTYKKESKFCNFLYSWRTSLNSEPYGKSTSIRYTQRVNWSTLWIKYQ